MGHALRDHKRGEHHASDDVPGEPLRPVGRHRSQAGTKRNIDSPTGRDHSPLPAIIPGESWRITPVGVEGAGHASNRRAMRWRQFSFHMLVHEPVSIVSRLGILALSVALDFRWKYVRGGQDEQRHDCGVQVGHHAVRELT